MKKGSSNTSPIANSHIPYSNQGFTIVELLVVIVVIGILAAITIVSYTGISSKATASALKSDLASAKKQLSLYYVDHGFYPTDLDANKCPRDSTPTTDTRYCLKLSTGNTFTYSTLGVTTSPDGFGLKVSSGTTNYTITNSSSPVAMSSLAATDPANWLAIGTQVWAKANLNVGTMVTGVTAQTNNAILEKYCFNDTTSNCTTYGALYQWDEAMQYVTTQGAQGICPTGSHIPSDTEYKTLEMQLGMTQAAADTTSWRGTNQGTQLKPGGTSGLNIPLAGYRGPTGPFDTLSSFGLLWSSSESSTSAWYRLLLSGVATAYRDTNAKGFGLSVRCLGN